MMFVFILLFQKRYLFIIFCILLFGSYRAVAQYTPTELASVPSPSAASLGRFGEVPVSFFTGTASIEIPLYTLQEEEITVPVALRYHASGFRPDQHPGWVGQGWALEAGGLINRIIHDQTDENVAGNGGPIGLLFNSTSLKNSHLNSLSEDEEYNIVNAGERVDTEPDEFNFSFGAYSGSFYWDINTAAWRVKCDKPITVTALDQTATGIALLKVPFDPPAEAGGLIQAGGYTPTLKGFVVTTEDGTRYVFGGVDTAIEYGVGLFQQLSERWVANSWYLTRIEKTNGAAVTFSYGVGEFIAQYYKQEVQSGLDVHIKKGIGTDWSCSQPLTTSFAYGAGDERCYTGTLIRPVYLSTITSEHAQLYFGRGTSRELQVKPVPYTTEPPPPAYFTNFYNYRFAHDYPHYGQPPTSWRFLPFLQPEATKRLTENADLITSVNNLKWAELQMILIQRVGSPTRSIYLRYNNNDNERLTLQEVQETGLPPYKFSYNISTKGYPALPPYMVDNTDHWGFYNNRPATSVATTGYFTTREPAQDTISVLLGMLNRITYPTGGVTDFRFEAHSYGQQLDTLRSTLIAPPGGWGTQAQAGGVRLRATKSYDLATPQNGVYKEYFYVSNYSATLADPRASRLSSGILGGQSQYRYNRIGHGDYNGYTVDTHQLALACQSVLSGSLNSKGSHIGYSEVVEKRRDGSYTRYKYSNFGPGAFDENGLYHLGTWASQVPYTANEQLRGNLLNEQVYNSQDQLVKERRLTYSSIAPEQEYVDAVNTTGVIPVGPENPLGKFFYIGSLSYYKIKTCSVLPATESTTLYDAQNIKGVTTTRTTLYNSHRLLATETETTSTNDVLSTTYKYPFDFSYTGPSPTNPITQALTLMPSRNIINAPIETLHYRNNSLIGSTVVTYTLSGSQVVPNQVLQLTPTQPLKTDQYTKAYFTDANVDGNNVRFMTDSNLQPMLTFGNYDSRANAGSVTKLGKFTSTQLWDYNKSLLVAKVSNASPERVAYTSFEADGTAVNAAFQTTGPLDWAYDPILGRPTHLQAGGVNGKFCYLLDGGNGVSRKNLPPGDYELTFWAQGGAGGVYVFTDQFVGPTDEYTNPQGYHLLHYRVRVTSGSIANPTGSINIDAYGRQVSIDDVRLYPTGAQMTTYTHVPLVGIGSQTDPTGRTLTYEYDGFGRLQRVRDEQGRILTQQEYKYGL
jgi:YD repeat-containing protein